MDFDDTMRFDQWISALFNQPTTNPVCYRRVAPDVWKDNPAQAVAYLTRTFEESDTLLRAYSDAQVAQSLNYLVNPSYSHYVFALRDAHVPLSDRLHCIEAMAMLFEKCFAPRCAPRLIHEAIEVPEAVNPLNQVCHLWWDVLPMKGLAKLCPEDPDAVALDAMILTTLCRVLALDAVACQESALFGLFYCSLYYGEINVLINAFIDKHPTLWERLCPSVRTYFFGKPWVSAPYSP